MNIFAYDTRTTSTSQSNALPVTDCPQHLNDTMSYDVAYVGFTIEMDTSITTRLHRVVTLHLFVAGETSQVLSNLCKSSLFSSFWDKFEKTEKKWQSLRHGHGIRTVRRFKTTATQEVA